MINASFNIYLVLILVVSIVTASISFRITYSMKNTDGSINKQILSNQIKLCHHSHNHNHIENHKCIFDFRTGVPLGSDTGSLIASGNPPAGVDTGVLISLGNTPTASGSEILLALDYIIKL